jgi:hypothetical protein
MSVNVLPSSRCEEIVTPRGVLWHRGMWWVPIYCPSCGTDGGYTPQDSTFLFWLCQECYEKYGDQTQFYVMPDEVFWQRLADEQLESYGRMLEMHELEAIVAADASPLATLIREGR